MKRYLVYYKYNRTTDAVDYYAHAVFTASTRAEAETRYYQWRALINRAADLTAYTTRLYVGDMLTALQEDYYVE